MSELNQFLKDLIDRAEHDALLLQSQAIYQRVSSLVERGWSPRRIARLYAQAPNAYPTLIRRIQSAATWMKRPCQNASNLPQ